MADPWVNIPDYGRQTIPGLQWFSWGRDLPAAVGEEELPQETRDMLAYLWTVNELLPYMPAVSQNAAANLIYQNRELLRQYWPEALPAAEGEGRYVQNWSQIPSWNWSQALGYLPQGGRSAHYGGFDLANALEAGGMQDSPYYQALQGLRSLGTIMEGSPRTAGEMRKYGQAREQGLAALSSFGPEWQQLGEWFVNPQYNVPGYSPIYAYGAPRTALGGARSWWG